MGAAGRDFDNFNTVYRNNPHYEVVAFTATQIPGIDNRKYPSILAGKLYPQGIPIFSEDQLEHLITSNHIDQVDFAYSDVAHERLMHIASSVVAAGADFQFVGKNHTMITPHKPLISVGAVRTGSGKSPTSFFIASNLKAQGKRIAVIRHPMPYGDLSKQIVQEFHTYNDFSKQKCTIEEMEEYEQYVTAGIPIFAGVDYEKILRVAEKHADVLLWDGGNNDIPFYKTRLHIVLADPHRPGHESAYYPGEVNVRMADVIIIGKCNTAKKANIDTVERNVRILNPTATIMKANLRMQLTKNVDLKKKKVLIIEDGPTLTHGDMLYGAGWEVAIRHRAIPIDPRRYAVGSIAKTYKKYPHLSIILPAMGYSKQQIKELQTTINRVPCDYVIIATPIDLGRILRINKPHVRVKYFFEEIGKPHLMRLINKAIR